MHIPDDLTGDARRAHLALHGQTLHDSWMKFCMEWELVKELRDRSTAAWAHPMASLIRDQRDLRPATKALDGNNRAKELGVQANSAHTAAILAWGAAVRAECGGRVIWSREGCKLSNGEHYDLPR